MEDAARQRLRRRRISKTTVLAQQTQRVVRRAAGVNHQWQVQRPARLDVCHKTLALPSHIGHGSIAQAVIVQTGLTDGHHFGQPPTLKQIVERGFLHAFVVGVNTG